jgi:hypothetical protein
MTNETDALYSFLEYGIKEMESQLKDIKPHWKDSTDPNERLEYDKRINLLNKLKEEIKTIKDGRK